MENDIFQMIREACTFPGKTEVTYTTLFEMYKHYLFAKCLHLFEWKGLDKLGIPSWEPELILMSNGCCGWSDKMVGKPGVYFGNYGTGPTDYYDIWSGFNIRCPKNAGVYEVGTEVAVTRNDPVFTSIWPLIHKYASMLAHSDLTYNVSMINHRANNGEVVVETVGQKTAYENYRDDLFEGRVGAIQAFGATDVGGIQKLGDSMGTTINPKEIIEAHKNIMDDFYHDIGVKTTWNKKGNMIQEEVNGDDKMLLFNLSDMLKMRQESVEDIKKMWEGKYDVSELSVDLSEELKYAEEEGEMDAGFEDAMARSED